MIGNAVSLFISWVIRAFALFLIAFAWLTHFGFWKAIGTRSLTFMQDSLVWPILITVIAGFLLAVGVVLGRGEQK